MDNKTLDLAVHLDLVITFISSLDLDMSDEEVMGKIGAALKNTEKSMPESISQLRGAREALVHGACLLSQTILGSERAEAVAYADHKRREEVSDGV